MLKTVLDILKCDELRLKVNSNDRINKNIYTMHFERVDMVQDRE